MPDTDPDFESKMLCVRFFWAPRKDTLDSEAERLRRFLNRLIESDPVWFPPKLEFMDRRLLKKNRTKAALKEVIASGFMPDDYDFPVHLRNSNPELRKLVARTSGLGPDSCSDLNFTLGKQWGLGLHIICCESSEHSQNKLILDFPRQNDVPHFAQPKWLFEFSKLIVECWDPDYGQVWSSNIHDRLQIDWETGIEVGWITYVSHRKLSAAGLDPKAIAPSTRPRRSPTHDESKTIAIPDRGILWMVGKEGPFLMSNQEYVRRIDALASALNPAPRPTGSAQARAR